MFSLMIKEIKMSCFKCCCLSVSVLQVSAENLFRFSSAHLPKLGCVPSRNWVWEVIEMLSHVNLHSLQ